MCISVDFPEPDGPMMAVKLPGSKSTVTPRQRVDGTGALTEPAGQVVAADDRLETGICRGRRGEVRCGSFHAPRLPSSRSGIIRCDPRRGRGGLRTCGLEQVAGHPGDDAAEADHCRDSETADHGSSSDEDEVRE